MYLTFLSKYLSDRTINKAEASKKTRIGKSRLSIKEYTNLKVEELYLISKTIEADPNDIL
jgi:hypothetical protein